MGIRRRIVDSLVMAGVIGLTVAAIYAIYSTDAEYRRSVEAAHAPPDPRWATGISAEQLSASLRNETAPNGQHPAEAFGDLETGE